MHICVIGDSWGGNIDYSRGIFSKLFDLYGHTVHNISAPGASNRGQLRMLEYQTLGLDNYDCILWIYTEPVRTFTEFVSLDYGDDQDTTISDNLSYKNFYQDLQYLAIKDFEYAQQLYNQHKIPFIVIGGAGTIDDKISDYDFSIWNLHSWNKEISQLEDMPVNCYIHHVVKMADFGDYKKDEVLDELNKLETLEKFMQSHPKLYPDTYHPSVDFYPKLVDDVISKCKEKKLI